MAYKEPKNPLTGKGRRHQESARKKEQISTTEFRRSDYKLTKPKVKRMIKELDEILEKGKMNANLRFAVEEIKKALVEENFELAGNLAGVKSYVSGIMEVHGFGEDNDYNKEALCDSIYRKLDGLAFELAMALDTQPYGSIVYSSDGSKEEREISKEVHPIFKMIKDEDARIHEDVRKSQSETIVSGPICKEDGLPMEFDHSEDDMSGNIYDVYRCTKGHKERFLVATEEE